MNNHQRGPKLAAILLLAAIVLSACQQSVSNAPLATPTLITPTGLFVTPLAGENPMQMIEEFAQGTAAAQTAAAGGATLPPPQAVSARREAKAAAARADPSGVGEGSVRMAPVPPKTGRTGVSGRREPGFPSPS